MISIIDFLQYINPENDSLNRANSVPNPADIQVKLDDARNHCPDLDSGTLKVLLGRQWFNNLEKLQYLISFIQAYVDSFGIVFISQTDRRLVRVYNHKTTVRNMIQQLIKAGVLCDLKTTYSFVGERLAKHYYVNRKNLSRLLELFRDECHSRKLKKKAPSFLLNASFKGNTESGSMNLKPLRGFRGFNSQMCIDMTEHSKIQIEEKLYELYPLEYYQELADSLNEDVEAAEFIKFVPSFSICQRNQNGRKRAYTTRIGIRATNSICPKPSIKNQNKIAERTGIQFVKDPNVEYREDYLSRILGDDRNDNDEFDVRASIPRVAHAKLFPKDGMGDLSQDIYEVIFSSSVNDLKQISPSIHSWKEAREFFKQFALRLHFSSSPEEILCKLRWAQMGLLRNNPDEVFEVNFLCDDEKYKKVVLEIISRWKNALDAYCGAYIRHSTEVFFDESCIYLEARAILQERGIRVVQVYDCFYFRHGEKPDDMEEIIREAERRYRKVCREHAEKMKQLNLRANAAKTA